MSDQEKYNFFNQPVFECVPDNARRILDFGCDAGNISAALKAQSDDRYVVGIEISTAPAKVAASRLDKVYSFNVEQEGFAFDEDPFDVVIFADVLEHLYNPALVLRKLLPFIANGGQVIACIPNIQHHSIIAALIRGSFQYQPTGLLDDTHIRFFCDSDINKLFLDAGYMPQLLRKIVSSPATNTIRSLVQSEVSRLNYGRENVRNTDVFQYVYSGKPLEELDPRADVIPMTIMYLQSNTEAATENLLASPILSGGTVHQIVALSATENFSAALNNGMELAENEIIVIVRENVYLPANWDRRVQSQLALAGILGNDWVCGIHGVISSAAGNTIIGSFVSSDGAINNCELPSIVDNLEDEVLLMSRDCSYRFTKDVGFGFRGLDLSLQAKAAGGKILVLDAPCYVSQKIGNDNLSVQLSGNVLLRCWPDIDKISTVTYTLNRTT